LALKKNKTQVLRTYQHLLVILFHGACNWFNVKKKITNILLIAFETIFSPQNLGAKMTNIGV
jgi:hypothetical protein